METQHHKQDVGERLMARPSAVLAVGSFHAHTRLTIERAGDQAEQNVHFAQTAAAGTMWLDDLLPSAVVLDAALPGARDVLARVRRDPRLSHVPLIVVADDLGELMFAEMCWWGAHDVVGAWDADGLSRRIQAASLRRPATVARPRGRAIVAMSEVHYRVSVAQVLSGAGYHVECALTTSELFAAFDAGTPSLVVLGLDTPPMGALLAVEHMRAGGLTAPTIVCVPPKCVAATSVSVRKLPQAAVHDVYAPPDNVLFLANQLLYPGALELRASPRLLFGTRVWLRPEGASEDVVGYSYNVSEGGMFVRTLFPLAPGTEVMAELTPPRSGRRVRVAARIAWFRSFGTDGALTPPGAGVSIQSGESADLEMFRDGCRRLAGALGFTPSRPTA